MRVLRGVVADGKLLDCVLQLVCHLQRRSLIHQYGDAGLPPPADNGHLGQCMAAGVPGETPQTKFLRLPLPALVTKPSSSMTAHIKLLLAAWHAPQDQAQSITSGPAPVPT